MAHVTNLLPRVKNLLTRVVYMQNISAKSQRLLPQDRRGDGGEATATSNIF